MKDRFKLCLSTQSKLRQKLTQKAVFKSQNATSWSLSTAFCTKLTQLMHKRLRKKMMASSVKLLQSFSTRSLRSMIHSLHQQLIKVPTIRVMPPKMGPLVKPSNPLHSHRLTKSQRQKSEQGRRLKVPLWVATKICSPSSSATSLTKNSLMTS